MAPALLWRGSGLALVSVRLWFSSGAALARLWHGHQGTGWPRRFFGAIEALVWRRLFGMHAFNICVFRSNFIAGAMVVMPWLCAAYFGGWQRSGTFGAALACLWRRSEMAVWPGVGEGLFTSMRAIVTLRAARRGHNRGLRPETRLRMFCF